MKKHLITFIGGGALILGIIGVSINFAQADNAQAIKGTIPVTSQSEAEFPAMAKISLKQAMDNASKASSGKVLKAELEDEGGFLVYSIEVVTPDQKMKEMILDAGSGQVLASHEDKADHDDRDKNDHGREEHENQKDDE